MVTFNTQLDSDYGPHSQWSSYQLDELTLYRCNIPATFDGRHTWRAFISQPLDQGKCGSCWAWASVGTLTDRFNILLKARVVNLSVAMLLLCDWNDFSAVNAKRTEATQHIADMTCFGNSLLSAYRYLYAFGTVEDQCVPYHPRIMDKDLRTASVLSDIPFCNSVSGKFQDYCADHETLPSGEETGEFARRYRAVAIYVVPATYMEQEIYQRGPISSAFRVYSDFLQYDGHGIYESTMKGDPLFVHAIEIVGWDAHAWIIKNSWGPHWGDGGYFRMRRGVDHCGIESNAITCLPDFYYHSRSQYESIARPQQVFTYKLLYDQSERKLLDTVKYGTLPQNIDPTTGYSLRIMKLYPTQVYQSFIHPELMRPLRDIIAGKISKVLHTHLGVTQLQDYVPWIIFLSLIYISLHHSKWKV